MDRLLKCRILWLVFFFGLTLSNRASAEPALTNASLPGDIYAGQATNLKLTFEWPSEEGSYQIKASEKLILHNFEILDVSQSQETYTSHAKRISRLTLIYKLRPKEAGRATINRFEVLFRKSRNEKWRPVIVPAIMMDVRPALPWKQILILTSIIVVFAVAITLWVVFTSMAEQQRRRAKERNTDPKQKIYEEALAKIDCHMFGCSPSIAKARFAEWSDELRKVIMTYYDMPLRPTTSSDILNALNAKNVSLAERKEIEGLFNLLDKLRFSNPTTGAFVLEKVVTDEDLIQVQKPLLQYVKGKIIIENSDS